MAADDNLPCRNHNYTAELTGPSTPVLNCSLVCKLPLWPNGWNIQFVQIRFYAPNGKFICYQLHQRSTHGWRKRLLEILVSFFFFFSFFISSSHWCVLKSLKPAQPRYITVHSDHIITVCFLNDEQNEPRRTWAVISEKVNVTHRISHLFYTRVKIQQQEYFL